MRHLYDLLEFGPVDWKLVIDGIAAFGTLGLAILAIWGDSVRAWLVPPRIELRLHTFRGEPVTFTNDAGAVTGHGRYYHLKAVNVSGLSVQDCRIMLSGMRRRGADGSWTEVSFPVPYRLLWSGEQPGPEYVRITTERVFDFGMLVDARKLFMPCLKIYPNDRDLYVRQGQAMRYELSIDAPNFGAAKPQTFEVSWDGEFPVVSIPDRRS